MTAFGRFIVFIFLVVAAGGFATAYAFADGAPAAATAPGTGAGVGGLGLTGWPAIAVAALYMTVFWLRTRAARSHWVHSRGITGLVAMSGTVCVAVAQAIERHGLSWEVVTSAIVTGVVGAMVVSLPEKKQKKGTLEVGS